MSARDCLIEEAQTLLTAFATADGCESAERAAVLREIPDLEDYVASCPEDTEARRFLDSYWFGFADESLRRGCLEDADSTYRRVLEFAVWSADTDLCDRAGMGIDGVRTARMLAQSK